MTSVSLKSDTQAAINAAVNAGGTDVALNVAAYNDIARDTQGTALNQGTINWFAGAGGVNGQLVTATAQGCRLEPEHREIVDLGGAESWRSLRLSRSRPALGAWSGDPKSQLKFE